MKIQSLIKRCLFSCVVLCAFAQADAPPKKIFIAGDSTAATYSAADQQGWGGVLGDYIDPTKAQVVNRCLLYTSPSPRDRQKSRMPSSA